MQEGVATPAAPVPPHDLDAEESVLGAIMLPGNALEHVQAEGLTAADFHRRSHGRIYLAAVDLHTHGTPVDAITIADYLSRQRGDDHQTLLEDVGGKERIHELATLVPAVSNAWHYARIVVRMATLRRQLEAGKLIAKLAQDGNDPEHTRQAALELLNTDGRGDQITVETWHQFESQAHDHIPVLVDRLWPEAAFGFIAAPPKKGKTWVALALSVAVTTGRPFLGEFTVPAPKPVLYVALEGHRAAIRARVGAIARGMGVDPDSDELDQLHFLYKPAGINLADPRWAQRLLRAARQVDAALVVVDVLRAGARIKENDQADFSNLRSLLQPLSDDSRSLALLHHFTKLTETSKERDPGERMSGSGAMFGALDAAIYITGSEDHARKLRLEFDLRDLATPDTIHVHLTGHGNGDNGGFTYRDAATFTVVQEEVDEDDFKKAPPQEIYDYIVANGGSVATTDVRGHFEISGDTLTRRIGRLNQMGVQHVGGKGRAGLLTVPPAPVENPQQHLDTATLDQPQVPARHEKPHAATAFGAATEPHNHAGLPEETATTRTEPVRQPESGDLQGKEETAETAPYGRASMPAATGAPEPPARHAAELWALAHSHDHDPEELADQLLTRWPTLGIIDLEQILKRVHNADDEPLS